MDMRRFELSQEIRESKLMAFLEIRREENALPEFHLFSEPMNTDCVSIKSRLGTALVFMGQYHFTPDIALDATTLRAHEFTRAEIQGLVRGKPSSERGVAPSSSFFRW
jgi:hypothetical protein